jgi:hypothetical protein
MAAERWTEATADLVQTVLREHKVTVSRCDNAPEDDEWPYQWACTCGIGAPGFNMWGAALDRAAAHQTTRLLSALADAGVLVEPGVWRLPPEPGPEVTAVRCKCHGRWDRGLGRAWYLTPEKPVHGPYRVYWPQLYGDHAGWRELLTDVSGEVAADGR